MPLFDSDENQNETLINAYKKHSKKVAYKIKE